MSKYSNTRRWDREDLPSLINKTPHMIKVWGEYILYPEDTPIRVDERLVKVKSIRFKELPREIDIFKTVRKLNFIPPEVPMVYYIVSTIAREAIRKEYPSRSDFLVPSDLDRDKWNQVTGCNSLIL